MKKTTGFLLALLLLLGCLSTLAGCGKRHTAADLSAYLDKEGFVAGMSQKEFVEKITKIEGEEPDGYNWDGEYGGGWNAIGTNSYSNSYIETEEEGVAVYRNTVLINVKPKGLKMPAGIRFSDTLAKVLKKLSVEGDPLSEFTPDPETPDVMTLFSEGNVTLKLIDRRLTPTEPEKTEPGTVVCVWDIGYPLELEFSEVTTRSLDYDRTDTVTRTVRFTFADRGSTLKCFSIDVTERYPLLQRYAKEAHAVFNALTAPGELDGYAFRKAEPNDYYSVEAEEPEMPNEAEVTVSGKRYTGTLVRSTTGAAVYRRPNDFPVFTYRYEGGSFETDSEGRLTGFTRNDLNDSGYAYSSEYYQSSAERFFRDNLPYVDIDDYTVSVSGPLYGLNAYAVTFTKTVDGVDTTDRATITMYGDPESFIHFYSSMLGRIRLTENPFDLESVGAAIEKKFRAAVGDSESLFVSFDCEIEKTTLTQLQDGTPALLVTITPALTEIRRDGNEWRYAKTETVIVRFAEE